MLRSQKIKVYPDIPSHCYPLKDCAMEAKTDISDAVTKTTLAVVQAILMNMLTGSHSSRGARVAELESFDGSRDKAEQFI